MKAHILTLVTEDVPRMFIPLACALSIYFLLNPSWQAVALMQIKKPSQVKGMVRTFVALR